MLGRCLALLFIPVLPWVPLMAPFGRVQAANAIIAGIIAIVCAAFSLVDYRARVAAAVVGGWVALSPFIFRATLLEEWILVTWGVCTFVLMVGPFSDRPRSVLVAALPARPQPKADDDHKVSLAA
jgi:hypothetical protein